MHIDSNYLHVTFTSTQCIKQLRHSLHPPPLSARGLNVLPNFQKKGGGLTGPQLLEGDW